MKRWITNVVVNSKNNAFGKAYTDIAEIAKGMSYEVLNIMPYSDSEDADDALISRIDGITAGVLPGDMVVYQYPSFDGARFDENFIDRMKVRGITVTVFIHDVFALFLSADGSGFHDMNLFNKADYVITHGHKMSKWLEEHGVKTPMITKNLFDYLIDEPEAKIENELKKELVVCGNLLKSPFLVEWNSETPLTAYGPASIVGRDGISQKMPLAEKVDYKGQLSQDELLRAIPKDKFGLAWDTDMPENMFENANFYGFFKNYTRYNNPHKISLYLTMGMPVIVWHESAVAELVEKYHLGLTIYSLSEIDARIQALSEEDLERFKQAANQFSRLLRNGFFTRKALEEIEEKILLNHWEKE